MFRKIIKMYISMKENLNPNSIIKAKKKSNNNKIPRKPTIGKKTSEI